MKMSRSGSGLQPLKATVPFTLHKPATAAVTNFTPGDRTKAEWRLQTQIRRTVSLDAIVWPYLQGQWPKEGDRHDKQDKSTQTPQAWLAGAETASVGLHKRSASWGNSERLQDGSDVCADSFFKLKQQLQQKKRSGILVGNQEKLHSQHQSAALLIPPASLTRLPLRLRQSEERLDQELEKVFTHHASVHHCGLYEVPDGHRAPVPHLRPKSGFQIGSSCVASHSSSSSSTSCSPQRPLDLETVEEVSSCILMLSSSPRPNNSYCFQRDPPEGCERVRVCEENVLPCLDQVYVSSCPDPDKVNFTTHTGSAFCPVNLPKPLLPPVDFLICSLSVSPGSCWVGQ
ncbi:Protein FAM117A [Labeo rohita]|uniref:Protein FAM117A n=1 Tax=Labeo rohita TaxID=84645 RepID=A0ABQ8M806_LABRO|nr:protein FAM117A [Labeo rohita]KAI2658696.1 Protein FAM117A [Labeo rohita]